VSSSLQSSLCDPRVHFKCCPHVLRHSKCTEETASFTRTLASENIMFDRAAGQYMGTDYTISICRVCEVRRGSEMGTRVDFRTVSLVFSSMHSSCHMTDPSLTVVRERHSYVLQALSGLRQNYGSRPSWTTWESFFYVLCNVDLLLKRSSTESPSQAIEYAEWMLSHGCCSYEALVRRHPRLAIEVDVWKT